ncbi:MAG: calcineurin-like phosphoesterase C-terminal domain-containing protein [Bacteroidales bacterium]|nr:calcineurin-like phosphoesterase C-terminal domain-containing protein [Bacteroidales bacterium]
MDGKIIFLLTAFLAAAACEKPEIPSSYFDGDGNEKEQTEQKEIYTSIEGTTIDARNNAVGFVSDRETGLGIAGIKVTDGYSFTVTDENGVYQFQANRYTRNIYISVPAEYEIPLDPKTKIPLFYSTGDFDRKQMNRNDFSLKKLPAVEENWTLIAVGDPQCNTVAKHDRYVTETIPDIIKSLGEHQKKGEYPNAYAITLGDIIEDSPHLWPSMKESMSNILVGERYLPFFQCIGNHDHNANYQTPYEASKSYIEQFGPTDYSFDRGKAHIVVMDNVICKENRTTTWRYDGGLTDQQWKWLQQDLSLVENKSEKMIIFVAHIPFRYGVESDGACVSYDRHYYDVLQALTEFNEAHLMIGHTHYTHNYIHHKYLTAGGTPVYEHVHCAACGAWWSGNLSAAGSPNGYTYYDIRGAGMHNWVARGTNMDDNDAQMRVYDGNASYGEVQGDKDYRFSWTGGGYMNQNSDATRASTFRAGQSILKDCFIAAIWGDDDSNWRVEIEYKGNTYPMQRIRKSIADMCVSAFYRTQLNKSTVTWSKDLSTYWYANVPGADPATAKGWTVKAYQTIPGSGTQNIYTCSDRLQTDYTGFAH